eukprot:NODE_6512_length_528_cov_88.079800_g6347_i0.p1 GENE.NODE_6512_length_528_cov_88.079800_g6347_i0~~NODE_6512_length_528_cov_88.079800_g6347_i0.p1  ORF type:complete len:124 (+),score=32.63 NODE_6512_length_528_cov_88.079800_g6347_i0:62-433(+)
MRLLTHNLLCGPKGGYPLKIVPSKVEILKEDYDQDYVQRLIPKLEWNGLLAAVNDLQQHGHLATVQLPAEAPVQDFDPLLLQCLHLVLNEIKVLEGTLECPDSHSQFTIEEGRPKMIFEENDA